MIDPGRINSLVDNEFSKAKIKEAKMVEVEEEFGERLINSKKDDLS